MAKLESILEIVNVTQVVKERAVEYSSQISSLEIATELAQTMIGDSAVENVLVMVLDIKHKINAIHKISTGTLGFSVLGVREIFRTAFLNNGAAIMLLHNHPSGDVTPSSADIKATKKIKEAGELLDVPLLDHIIVSPNEYFSFAKEGPI